MSAARIEVLPVPGLPELAQGDRLGELIARLAQLQADDVVVVSHKAVSKVEGRIRRLADVEVTDRAATLAAQLGKEPEVMQLILDESRSILRAERGIIIAETSSGLVCANAGIDASNLVAEGTVALLPEDPDASARRIRAEIAEPHPAVLIADSFGRPWRLGQVEVAIGAAGLQVIDDWRGRRDRSGRRLEATAIAIADQAAAAADLVRDKTSGTPAVVVRGLGRYVSAEDGPGAAALQRPAAEDLFR